MWRWTLLLILVLVMAVPSAVPAGGRRAGSSGVVIEDYGPRPSARQVTTPTLSPDRSGDAAPALIPVSAPVPEPTGPSSEKRLDRIQRLLHQNRSLIRSLNGDDRPAGAGPRGVTRGWRPGLPETTDPGPVGTTSPTTNTAGRPLPETRPVVVTPVMAPRHRRLSRQRLVRLIRRRMPKDPHPGLFTLSTRRGRLLIRTTIDPRLQRFVTEMMRHAKVVRGAAVFLEPSTGRILALANFDALKGRTNVCLQPILSASLFKIITASAALESGKLTPRSILQYKGGKYTLRESQMSRRITNGTNLTTLENAFAQSINPAFGAAALFYVGVLKMNRYARRFLFNRRLPFSMPLGVSHYERPQSRIALAAAASGLNKKNSLSPLHAALICSSFINQGRMMAPWLVAQVIDRRGREIYRGHPELLAHPVSWRTALQMQRLMRATIRQGTGRRVFARVDHDSVLGRLQIGAKSGTLNSRDQTLKLDWFAGWAREVTRYGRGKAVAFAVFMGHSRRWGRGVRAQVIARQAIRYYFQHLFHDRRIRPTVVRRRY
jgi:peptidoglycan glycosyltransferase